MSVMQMLSLIRTTLIIITVLFVVWIFGDDNKAECTSNTFEYSDLNNYYINCLSWHDGSGTVIINVDGTYKLTCADGHAPSEPRHPIKQSNPLVRGD